MTKELNLRLPDSLFSLLSQKSKEQGVSIEALCISLLAQNEKEKLTLVEPALYSFMGNGELREEIQRVLQSELPPDEMKRRVQGLKLQIARCIR